MAQRCRICNPTLEDCTDTIVTWLVPAISVTYCNWYSISLNQRSEIPWLGISQHLWLFFADLASLRITARDFGEGFVLAVVFPLRSRLPNNPGATLCCSLRAMVVTEARLQTKLETNSTDAKEQNTRAAAEQARSVLYSKAWWFLRWYCIIRSH